MFDPQEALSIHTLSKSCNLMQELFLTNHLSFQELVNFGPTCHPLPLLNPTTYLASNLTSTNLIASLYLGLCYRLQDAFPDSTYIGKQSTFVKYFSYPFGCYSTLHTLMSAGQQIHYIKEYSRFLSNLDIMSTAAVWRFLLYHELKE